MYPPDTMKVTATASCVKKENYAVIYEWQLHKHIIVGYEVVMLKKGRINGFSYFFNSLDTAEEFFYHIKPRKESWIQKWRKNKAKEKNPKPTAPKREMVLIYSTEKHGWVWKFID